MPDLTYYKLPVAPNRNTRYVYYFFNVGQSNPPYERRICSLQSIAAWLGQVVEGHERVGGRTERGPYSLLGRVGESRAFYQRRGMPMSAQNADHPQSRSHSITFLKCPPSHLISVE